MTIIAKEHQVPWYDTVNWHDGVPCSPGISWEAGKRCWRLQATLRLVSAKFGATMSRMRKLWGQVLRKPSFCASKSSGVSVGTCKNQTNPPADDPVQAIFMCLRQGCVPSLEPGAALMEELAFPDEWVACSPVRGLLLHTGGSCASSCHCTQESGSCQEEVSNSHGKAMTHLFVGPRKKSSDCVSLPPPLRQRENLCFRASQALRPSMGWAGA